MLLIEESSKFGRELLRGVCNYANTCSKWILYMEPRSIDSKLPDMQKWKLDGVITRESPNFEKIIKTGIPVIYSGQYQETYRDTPVIITDAEEIGKMGVEYFLEREFCNFAYCGFEKMSWSHNRNKIFCREIENRGLRCFSYSSLWSDIVNSWEVEITKLANWLRDLPKPLAVMACNDPRAKHVLEACENANIAVPEEVAILGIDNDLIYCLSGKPSLSSIELNVEKAGYQAAELLDRLMMEGKPKKQTITIHPTHIITRESTDIFATEDRLVADILHFIYHNASNIITVDDVANEIGFSRRTLERRFKTHFGITIQSKIEDVHIEHSKKLLENTNWPISRIAKESGFSDASHFSVVFRKVLNMSPSVYRKTHIRN